MGEVFDVAVDCRPNSKTFGKWVGVTLSAENKKMLWIPEGFAHGFLVLSDVAEFCYKCTDVYDPTAEGGIPYDDADRQRPVAGLRLRAQDQRQGQGAHPLCRAEVRVF